NIAQIAERIGDLEVAIASYGQYLLLVPDAKDAQEVNEKTIALKERLAKARQKAKEITAVTPFRGVQPPPTESSAGQPLAGGSAPVEHDTNPSESVVVEKSSPMNYRRVAWIVYGGAGAALVAGLVTNLLARDRMNTCRSKWNNGAGDISGAEAACSDAKPLAYLSYGLIGVGAAAAVVGTVLVLRPTESSEVGMNLLPEGGLVLGWSGRF
ncbi:MAG TPA: hypothetical protein VF550_13290, partial [Polyangia bacterium]